MKKKLLLAAAAVTLCGAVAAAVLLTGFSGSGETQSAATQVRTSALEKGDLAVSVSASGTVYSPKTTSVYSEINYPVKTVHVSVGDRVRQGDVLAELDLSDLTTEIAQQKASLEASRKSAGLRLSTAQTDLNNYYRDIDEGYETSLLNAKDAVASAKKSLADAERSIESSTLSLESAGDSMQAAREDYNDARDLEADEETIETARETYQARKNSYDQAELNLESAKANFASAERALEKAEASYEAAKLAVQDNYASYQTQVQEASLGTDVSEQELSLEQLEAELENSIVLAPVSGTVTEVYAEPGVSGSGNGSSVLFIIQDTDNLKVVANIMEYDVGSVKIGNRAVVTTDATGDIEIGGTLSKIAPTSTLTATGESSGSSTEAEYQSEVTVAPEGSRQGIKVGMNAQLSIVTEERKDVFSVLYDAVVRDRERQIIYVMEPTQGADGAQGFRARAVEVTTGLENDLYIEISGEGLAEGMEVISDASGITEGMAVEPRGALQASGESQAGGMGFGMPGMGGPPNMR
jgi:multidrug efflux pump subunit AcrA (membrane-fusion protein)